MSIAILNARQDCLDGDSSEICVTPAGSQTTLLSTQPTNVPTPTPALILNTIPASISTEPATTRKPSKIVVATPLIVASTTDLESLCSPTATAEVQPSQARSSDTTTVLITVGCVGSFALFVLMVYWLASHIARRRYSREREKHPEEGTYAPAPMVISSLQDHLQNPTIPQRSMDPGRIPDMTPFTRKTPTVERQSKNPYNTYFTDVLGKHTYSMHPGTKVFFGGVGLKEVPARKPVPGSAKQQTLPVCTGTNTESVWSTDGDDTSTVLGDTGRVQRKTTEEYRPLPPGRTIASWLGGGFQRPGSSKGSANESNRSSSGKKGGNGSQRSNSGKGRLGRWNAEDQA